MTKYCEMCEHERENVCEWCDIDAELAKFQDFGDIKEYYLSHEDYAFVVVDSFETINGFTGFGHPLANLMQDHNLKIKRITDTAGEFRLWLVQ